MAIFDSIRNMSVRGKILLTVLIIIILLVIAGALLFFTAPKKKPAPPVQLPIVQEPVKNNIITNTVNPLSLQEAINQQDKNRDVRLVAEPFLERFGSYNNQGSFQNFTDLEPIMTDSLSKWLFNSYLPRLKKEMPPVDTYFAINTKVISSDVVNLDEEKGSAELSINTQRQEIGATGTPNKVYFQEATVKLVKVGEEWKVDGVFWR